MKRNKSALGEFQTRADGEYSIITVILYLCIYNNYTDVYLSIATIKKRKKMKQERLKIEKKVAAAADWLVDWKLTRRLFL